MIYQIEEILPRERWVRIRVSESGEQLVEVKETDRIVHAATLGLRREANAYFVRKTIAGMLAAAAAALPPAYRLVMVEGVRSLERQQLLWDAKCRDISMAIPGLTPEEIERRARLVVAMPFALANHNCGGAVDVTVMHADGTLADMGTPMQDVSDAKKARMFSAFIAPEQRANRLVLRRAMIGAGFAYYPGEWWHYCYGDRMWAVYTGRTSCFYGPIQALFESK